MSKRKNAMTKEPADKTAPDSGRRRFLNRLWALLGLAAAAELCVIGASFLVSRARREDRDKDAAVVIAGTVDQFKPGSVTAIPKGRFFLSRLPDGGFLALSPACTHLGCMVTWDEKQNRFACPCHGSAFSAAGEVLTGPASRPLDYYPTRIENGVVKTDASTALRRSGFEPDQAVRM